MTWGRERASRQEARRHDAASRSRRQALRLLLASACVAAVTAPHGRALAAGGPAAGAPPNIVLILADDLGVEGINAYGGEYFTPRVDQLARQGVRLTNAHATPLCTPSRVRLLTGRESAKNYKAFGYLDPAEQTLATLLRKAGYATAVAGKWQLSGNGYDGRIGATPEQAGFQESLLWQTSGNGAKGSRYWGPTLTLNGRTKTYEEGFGPEIQARFALDFIERRKDRPFFLFYAMALPHDPFVTTPDSPRAGDDKAKFAGMVTYADKLVGQVMDKLDELGLAENTLVVFTGDNGTNHRIISYRDGRPVQGGKGDPTVSGTHVPFIARWPGRIPAGEVRDGLLDLMDLAPTLARVGGVQPPDGSMDGVDQMPVLKGERPAARDWIFIHYAPVWIQEPARLVFDARWKLYGDGRFVRIDDLAGQETPVTAAMLTGPVARRRAEFQKILDTMGDGPLDQDRYPMCIGKPSLKPDQPAVRAGCKFGDVGS